eukprot:3449017-Prymnesium_polylepis.1
MEHECGRAACGLAAAPAGGARVYCGVRRGRGLFTNHLNVFGSPIRPPELEVIPVNRVNQVPASSSTPTTYPARLWDPRGPARTSADLRGLG